MIRLIVWVTIGVVSVLGTLSAVAGGIAGVNAVRAFVRPVAGAVISQAFGCTNVVEEPADASCPGGHWHSGIDLAAPRGTPVVAARAGVVEVVVSSTGYGIHVIVDHGGGLSTLYAHLETVVVVSGEWVATGERIGLVGTSGNSTGPHLHFEVRRDGVPEDPSLDVTLP